MRSALLTCGLVLLSACDKDSDDSSSGVDDSGDDSGGPDDSGKGDDSGASVDADNDGYDSTEDCDDANADVNPGATEVCDEIDNNCVDGIDEGLTTPYYADTDGDTYGAGTAVDACTVPSGHVENADDCDDTDAAVNPGATEVCDEIDNNCLDGIDEDVTTPYYADGDADAYGAGTPMDACAPPSGYVDNADDCDDLDAAAHPGASEVCDGIDNDCDADVDDDDSSVTGTSTWYQDYDGDGYGADWRAYVTACEAPTGYVADGSDCNDWDSSWWAYVTMYYDLDLDGYGDYPTDVCWTPSDYYAKVGGDCDNNDASINPGMTEICNDVDDDCDTYVDGDDKSIVYTTWWYVDADEDGYGDDSTVIDTCDDMDGYVTQGGDCDDTEYMMTPGRSEYCDGVDNNCDGTADEVTDYVDWYRDDDGDHYGSDDDIINDCLPQKGYDANGGDCDDTNADVNPGVEDDVLGEDVDDDCDGYVDNGRYDIADAMFSISGTVSFTEVSYSVGSGDVNGDGTDDLLVGSPFVGDSYSSGGAIYLVNGPATGNVTVSDADATITGETYQIGTAIASDDVDVDGYDDMLLPASASEVYLFQGPISSTTTLSADATFTTTMSYSGFGSSIALADVDSDGYLDSAIAEPYDYPDYTGRINVFMGPSSGSLSSPDLIITGRTTNAWAGTVVNVGDVDGGGSEDLAQAAYALGSSLGDVVLLDPGSSTGTVSASTIATATFTGENSGDAFGYYRIAGGDFNNDGYSDLFVSAYGYSDGVTYGLGRVYGWLGPVSGAHDASSADVMVTGEVQDGCLGYALDVGDVRGDAGEEVVIGYPFSDDYKGQVFVLDGPTTGSIDLGSMATVGAAAADETDYGQRGYSVGTIGDWSGDGVGDLIVGGDGMPYDAKTDYAGRAWVVASEDL